MPDDARRNNEPQSDSEVEAVQGNLLQLLRLLAKEVAHRLAHKTDDTPPRGRRLGKAPQKS